MLKRHFRNLTLKQEVEITGGGGFFHSKGTWGCAARKGILFHRYCAARKGILLLFLV